MYRNVQLFQRNQFAIRPVSANSSLTGSDSWICVTNTGATGAVTVSLPQAVAGRGPYYFFVTTAGKTLSAKPALGDTIRGYAVNQAVAMTNTGILLQFLCVVNGTWETIISSAPGSVATATFNYYVNPAGSNSNDGQSVGQPFLTIQQALDVLQNFGPLLPGTFKINLAAGTYTEGGKLSIGLREANRLQILGPTIARPGTPTAIIDGTTAVNPFAFYGQRESNTYIQDVLAQNFSVAGQFGFVVEEFSDLYTANVWTANCDTGIKAQQSRLFVDGGDINGGRTGVTCISGTTLTLGHNDTASGTGHGPGVGPYIHDQTVQGVLIQENSTGHVDFTTVNNAVIGLDIVEKSRANCNTTVITNNSIGVKGRQSSSYAKNGVTYSGNTNDEVLESYSGEINRSGNFPTTARQWMDRTATTYQPGVAGFVIATPTIVRTITAAIKVNTWTTDVKSYRLKVVGNSAGVGGTKVVAIDFAGGASWSFTLPAAGTGAWTCEGTLIPNNGAGTAQLFDAVLSQNGQPSQNLEGALAINLQTGADLDAHVSLTINNAGDTVTIHRVEGWVTGE